jgi:hypothetical protein
MKIFQKNLENFLFIFFHLKLLKKLEKLNQILEKVLGRGCQKTKSAYAARKNENFQKRNWGIFFIYFFHLKLLKELKVLMLHTETEIFKKIFISFIYFYSTETVVKTFKS